MLNWKRSLPFVLLMVLQLVPTAKAYGDEFRFTASLDLREQYIDNVFFSETNVEKDFRTIISPKIELAEGTERLDAHLSARLAGNIWAKNDELNALDQFYLGDVEYRFTPRMGVSVEAGYSRDSQIDREITTTGFLLGTDVRKRKRFGVSANYVLSEIAAAALSYDYEDVDFDTRERVDYELQSANLGFTRDLSDLILLTTGRTDFGFAHYNSSNTTLDSYSWTVGGSYKLHETLSAHLDIGARYTRSEFKVTPLEPVTPTTSPIVTEEAESQQWSGVAELALSYAGEVTTANVTAFHDLRPASGRSGAALRTSLGFDVGRRFAYEFWGKLGAEYFFNKSNRGEFSIRDIDEETVRLNPRLSYNFTENLSLEAGYSYVKVFNHVNDRKPDRNLIYVRFYIQYPVID